MRQKLHLTTRGDAIRASPTSTRPIADVSDVSDIPRAARASRLIIPAVPAPLAPFDAYRADVERLGGVAPLCVADDAWILVAHTLARAARAQRPQQATLLAGAAAGLRGLAPEWPAAPEFPGDSGGSRDARLARTVAVVADAFDALANALRSDAALAADVRDAALAAVQDLAADAETISAFQLARVMLSAARTLLAPALDAHAEGLLLAQEGRVARQLNELAAADALYQRAARLARTAHAPDVAARALVGLGNLYSMRGNYPEARSTLQRAIRAARRADSSELLRAAHHGLLFAAHNANDVDMALTHGWAAVQYIAPSAPDERAEALINLAALGRLCGADRAAIGACLHGLELTANPRLQLAALGTAVQAAARLRETRLVSQLTHTIDRVIARAGRAYESTHTLTEVAEGLLDIDAVRAGEYAVRAGVIARAEGFHEFAFRAERVTALVAERLRVQASLPTSGRSVGTARTPVRSTVARRTAHARAALRSMESLTALDRYLTGIPAI